MSVEALQVCEFLVFLSTKAMLMLPSSVSYHHSCAVHGESTYHMPAAREKKAPPLSIGRAGYAGWSWLGRLDRGGNRGGGRGHFFFTVELGRDVSAWREGGGGGGVNFGKFYFFVCCQATDRCCGNYASPGTWCCCGTCIFFHEHGSCALPGTWSLP